MRTYRHRLPRPRPGASRSCARWPCSCSLRLAARGPAAPLPGRARSRRRLSVVRRGDRARLGVRRRGAGRGVAAGPLLGRGWKARSRSAKTDPADVEVERANHLGIACCTTFRSATRPGLHLRAGGGSTKYGDPCPVPCRGRPSSAAASAALVAGAGVRVGSTPGPACPGRGHGDSQQERSRPESSPTSASSLGLSYMLGSKPIPDSDGDGVLENRDRCPDTPVRRPGGRHRAAPATATPTACRTAWTAAPTPPPGAAVNATRLHPGLRRRQHRRRARPLPRHRSRRAGGSERLPQGQRRRLHPRRPRPLLRDAARRHGGRPRLPGRRGRRRGAGRPRPLPPDANRSDDQPHRLPHRSGAGRQPPRRPHRPAAPPAAAAHADAAAPQARRGAAVRSRPAGPPAARTGGSWPGVLPGVGFAPGTARLRPESYVALDSIADDPSGRHHRLRAEIGAHTDNAGHRRPQNQHLSNLQAEAVRTYLVTKGVNFQQVQARGYGGTVPLTPDNTPRGRRRTGGSRSSRSYAGP